MKFLEEIKNQKSKREYHIKYNYMKNQEISKIIEKLEKSKEKYEIKSRYNDIEEIKDFKIYQIEDIEILDLKEKYILIRKDEKSFFYNIFIQLEYIEKISNFIFIKDLKYIILDIEENYIK